jgi:hypothetical protein
MDSSTTPRSNLRRTASPASLSTCSTALFAASASAVKTLTPRAGASETRCSSSNLATPRPCMPSATARRSPRLPGRRSARSWRLPPAHRPASQAAPRGPGRPGGTPWWPPARQPPGSGRKSGSTDCPATCPRAAAGLARSPPPQPAGSSWWCHRPAAHKSTRPRPARPTDHLQLLRATPGASRSLPRHRGNGRTSRRAEPSARRQQESRLAARRQTFTAATTPGPHTHPSIIPGRRTPRTACRHSSMVSLSRTHPTAVRRSSGFPGRMTLRTGLSVQATAGQDPGIGQFRVIEHAALSGPGRRGLRSPVGPPPARPIEVAATP